MTQYQKAVEAGGKGMYNRMIANIVAYDDREEGTHPGWEELSKSDQETYMYAASLVIDDALPFLVGEE